MEKKSSYFSGEWYKKKSFYIVILMIVLVVAIGCIAIFAGNGKANDTKQAVTVTYDEAKNHYGIYNETISNVYSCRDINGNKLTGYRMIVRAEMKKPMTKEEIYNDAVAIDKNSGAVETEIHFIYKLDNSYNVTVNLCKGEIFKVSLEGRKFITKDQWLSSFDDKEA